MKDKLGINEGHKSVMIGADTHAIAFGEIIKPTKEYKIHTYAFLGEKGTKADGCLFEIIPHGSTRVMRVVDENVNMQEIAIKGKGWFLGIATKGDISVREVGENVNENPVIEQQKGQIGVWIAGDAGMEVLNITEPPFNPSVETLVERNDPTIPPKFWEKYDSLKNPTKI